MNVCIVIPVYKTKPIEFEIISIKRCFEILSEHDVYLVYPLGMTFFYYPQNEIKKAKLLPLDPLNFQNIESYNKLLLNPSFYQKFYKYDYMLIYQTDAYVFKNELEAWMKKDYDYVGGVWFKNFFSEPNEGNLWIGGNGGFSLRKVASMIKILSSKKEIEPAYQVLMKILNREYSLSKLTKVFGVDNNLQWWLKNYKFNEDVAFSIHMPSFFPWFRIAPLDEAMNFSFDRNPEFLFKYNNYTLPFGCHAWFRDDEIYKGNLSFWLQFINR